MKIISESSLSFKILAWLIFGLILYFPVFQDIDRHPIQFWDESRNAINAFEMAENGNYLIRHYNGQPDMWELNPPLLTWLQSTSMRIFGYNEFALRFPISLAVLSTVFLLIYFFKKEFNTYWPGILSALVLISSSGYIDMHIGRTGDHDAVLILFLTVAALNYYRHLKYFEQSSKYLIYTTLFLVLAVYTKSIAGLFILPGLFTYTLFKKQLKVVFSDYRTYLSFVVFTALVAFYYLLREHYNPGYLNNVWNDQLFPRFTNSSLNHEYKDTGTWDYFINLFEWRFQFWIPTLVLPLILKNKIQERGYWDIVLLAYLCPLTLLLILSTGTKHIWYDGPVFPFLSIVCGIGLFVLFQIIKEKIDLNVFPKKMISVLLLILVFYAPYSLIIDKVYKSKEHDSRLYNGLFIRHLKKENKHYLNYHMFFRGYNAPVEFYIKALNSDGKHNVNVLGDQVQNVLVHDTIMSCDWDNFSALDSAFHLSTIEKFEHCRMYVVDSLKN